MKGEEEVYRITTVHFALSNCKSLIFRPKKASQKSPQGKEGNKGDNGPAFNSKPPSGDSVIVLNDDSVDCNNLKEDDHHISDDDIHVRIIRCSVEIYDLEKRELEFYRWKMVVIF